MLQLESACLEEGHHLVVKRISAGYTKKTAKSSMLNQNVNKFLNYAKVLSLAHTGRVLIFNNSALYQN